MADGGPDPGEPEALADATPRPAGVLANILYGLLAQAITSVFTVVLTLYLVRALGPDAFGIFSLALGVGTIALTVSDFGLASAAAIFVARRRDDVAELARVARAGLRLKLAAAFVTSVALALLADPIARAYDHPSLALPVRIMAASMFFESLLMLYTSINGALRRVSVTARLYFVESLFETTASVAIVALGGGAAGALAGRAAGYVVAVVLGAVLLARVIGRLSLRKHPRDDGMQREVARHAAPLIVTNAAYAVYAQIDSLLIGALLSARAVGEFAAPMRIVTVVGYVGQSVASAVSPRLAGDDPDTTAFFAALRTLIVIQALIAVPLLAWPGPIVDLLLGSEYREAPEVMLALVPYLLLHGVSPLITMTVTFLGDSAKRVPIAVFALVVNVVLDLLLIPVLGIVGAAVGTGIAYLIYVPAHLRLCLQRFGGSMRPVGVTVARAAAGTLLAAGAMRLIGPGDALALWQWVAGSVAGVVVYGAVLYALGEVRGPEVRGMRDFLRGR